MLALPVLALAAGIAAGVPAHEPQELRGHYTVRWEEQSFTRCGSSEHWWVSDPGPLMRRYRELVQGDYGTIYVTVRADVTDRGMFGHLGMYPRAIAVREVVQAREAGSDDCRGRDVEVE
jgi:NlpE-like protein